MFFGILFVFQLFFKTEFKLKPVLELTSLSYPVFLDYNRDGKDEIIRKEKYYDRDCFLIYEQNGNVIAQVNPMAERAGFVGMVNIDGTGNDEAIFWFLRENKLFLFIYNLMDSRGWWYPLFEVKDMVLPEGWEGQILPYGLYPLYENDELKDIIFFINVGFDRYPRGVFCFDLKTKKVKWNLWIAPQINDWKIIDINGDGKKEILISTSAPCNGAVIRDENDCTSYIYLIDLNGNLIWKREIGGFGSHLRFGTDKNNRIFVCETMGSRESGDKRKIICLDGETGGILRKIELSSIFNGFCFFDINGDGNEEIVVSTSKGKIIVFNQNLEKIKEIENEYSGKILKVVDLDGDGNNEILTENKGYLYILNSKFEKLGEYFMREFHLTSLPYYPLCKNEGRYMIPLWTRGKFLILDFEKEKNINPFPFYILFTIILLSLSFSSGFLLARKISKHVPLISKREHMLIDLIYQFIHEIKNSISFLQISLEKSKFKEDLKGEIGKIYEISAYLTDFLKIHNKKFEKVNVNKIIENIIHRFRKIKDDIE